MRMQEKQLGLEGIPTPPPLPLRFSIVEASKATGKSTDAIRRAIKSGKINTTRNPLNNAYEMTLEALLKAGFTLTAQPKTVEIKPNTDLEAKVRDLEEQLARERSEKDRLFKLLEELPRALGAGVSEPKRSWWRR